VRIAVVGARGQLGAAIVHECAAAHALTPLSRKDLDVTDDRAIASVIGDVRPDAIVNCAAYNDVDGAEDHPVDALSVNAFAVRAIGAAAERQGAVLVHYSSDFVFDGAGKVPYTEEDRPSPRSVYAASKLLGEWFALDVPKAYVLRVESLFGAAPGGPPPRGSVAGILNTILAGGSPRVFEDRIVSPTYIPDAARATRELLEMAAPFGLYHCVNSGYGSWLAFARELARCLGPRFVEMPLTPIRMADVTQRAERPRFCALSNAKLRSVGIEMPAWEDAVWRHVSSLDRRLREVPGH
jgi:dTDP-4-dehydrorhamnose reductase